MDITICDIHEPMVKQTLPTIPVERVENFIYLVRGERVMLDSDLARIYGVSTSNFNKAVNEMRFVFR